MAKPSSACCPLSFSGSLKSLFHLLPRTVSPGRQGGDANSESPHARLLHDVLPLVREVRHQPALQVLMSPLSPPAGGQRGNAGRFRFAGVLLHLSRLRLTPVQSDATATAPLALALGAPLPPSVLPQRQRANRPSSGHAMRR